MASNEAQRLVIKIAADTSEFEASLGKLKSTASGIVAPSGGGRGKSPGDDAAANAKTLASSLDETALRLADVRAQSKSVGMSIYRNIGNPFLVVSSLSQRITGIYKLQRELEDAGAATEHLVRQLAQARRNGDAVQIQAFNTQLDAAIQKQSQLTARLGSFGTKMRGFADFFVNQFLTAGLFGFFMLNTMLIQGLTTAGVSMVRSLVDPMGVAKERAKELADIVNKFGGPNKLALALDMSEEDRKLLEAAVRMTEQQTAFERRLAVERGLTESAGLTPGQYTEDEIKRLRMEAALRATGSKGFEADLLRFFGWDWTFGAGGGVGDAGRQAGEAVTNQALARQAQLDYARQLVEVARQQGALDEEQRRTLLEVYGIEGQRLLTAYDLLRAQKDRTAELQRERDQLERDRYRLTGERTGLGTGEGAGMDKWFMIEVGASRRIEQLQRAQSEFSRQMTRRQQSQTLGQARADVVRAGIGRPGLTGFELAAQVLEARERAREAREQVQVQRRQEGIQRKIEYWNSVQANAKRQQDIMANAVALGLNNAQLALTVDPKSGQLIARFVAGDVYNMMAGAAANNTPVTGGGGRGTGRIPTP